MIAVIGLWIVLGAALGLMAGRVGGGTGAGPVGDALAGLIGALIGGLVTLALTDPSGGGFATASAIVAGVGAVLLVVLVRVLGASLRAARFG